MIHIKNVRVCDGTGREPFPGELLLQGERIAAVSERPLGDLDAQTIDGEGQLAAPGFIDAHRHCDLAALYDPKFGELELSQGLTTVVMGNCGLAPAPCREDLRQELYDFIEPCLGKAPGDSFFPKVSDFMAALESRPHPLNLGVLGATGAITTACKGYGDVPFTEDTRKQAEAYVRDAMEAGALGLSCGIMYTPECYSTTEDFACLAKAAGEYGGYLTSHIRGEGNSLAQSVAEVLEIGRKAGVGVNVSHFKVTGLKNHGWGIEKAIALLEEARSQGQDATADAYPYGAGSTTILSLVPPTVLQAAGGDLYRFLDTRAGRDLAGEELARDFPQWDNMVASIGWERIVLSSAVVEEHRALAGLSFTDAARQTGMGEVELFCRLIVENRGKVGIILQSMAPADVDRVLTLPWVSVISDALYGGGDMPHPRLYGAFPKFLREYVREKKLLTLGEAVRKMTSLPAKRLGLKDRGALLPGYYADVLLFDPAKFTDRATFQSPKELAAGLSRVFVNGKDPRRRGGKLLKRN